MTAGLMLKTIEAGGRDDYLFSTVNETQYDRLNISQVSNIDSTKFLFEFVLQHSNVLDISAFSANANII